MKLFLSRDDPKCAAVMTAMMSLTFVVVGLLLLVVENDMTRMIGVIFSFWGVSGAVIGLISVVKIRKEERQR